MVIGTLTGIHKQRMVIFRLVKPVLQPRRTTWLWAFQHAPRPDPSQRSAPFQAPPPPQPQPTAPGPNSYTPRDFGCAAQHCQSSAHTFSNSHQHQANYKIRGKGIKYLPVFDGEHAGYKYWKNKLTDHMAKNNDNWRALLKGVELHPAHIVPEWLFTLRLGNSNG